MIIIIRMIALQILLLTVLVSSIKFQLRFRKTFRKKIYALSDSEKNVAIFNDIKRKFISPLTLLTTLIIANPNFELMNHYSSKANAANIATLADVGVKEFLVKKYGIPIAILEGDMNDPTGGDYADWLLDHYMQTGC